MTQKDLIKCVYDYKTCTEHDCRHCSAYKAIEFEDCERYRVCNLFNIFEFGKLANEEDEN